MYERFTDGARKAMQHANRETHRLGHQRIGTEHILLGLFREGNGIAANVLRNRNLTFGMIHSEVEKLASCRLDLAHVERLPQSVRAKKAITNAMDEARKLDHDYFGTEHILLGIIRQKDAAAVTVLKNLGLEPESLHNEILFLLGDESSETQLRASTAAPPRGRSTSRILDAAANRAGEGLRVVEDYVRFVLDDAHLTELIKTLRHDLAATIEQLPSSERHAARDTQSDVGTEITTEAELMRADAWQVCQASLERSKQSLRSLEEFSKVDQPVLPVRFEQLRYQLYTLEKALSITRESKQQLASTKLCVLLDGRGSQEEFSALADTLIQTSVPMIQLRDKKLSDAELVQRGRALRELKRNAETLLIVNDRPDIAVAVGADGVHLGQNDMSVKDARAIVGPRTLIGVSTHNIEQARQAVLDGANYLGAGPTFPSATKQFDDFPGLPYLRQVASEITLPTFAIGGIGEENAKEVLSTGIGRIAVSSAVIDSEYPAQVASDLLEILSECSPPAIDHE